jgi:hypothetical protein
VSEGGKKKEKKKKGKFSELCTYLVSFNCATENREG